MLVWSDSLKAGWRSKQHWWSIFQGLWHSRTLKIWPKPTKSMKSKINPTLSKKYAAKFAQIVCPRRGGKENWQNLLTWWLILEQYTQYYLFVCLEFSQRNVTATAELEYGSLSCTDCTKIKNIYVEINRIFMKNPKRMTKGIKNSYKTNLSMHKIKRKYLKFLIPNHLAAACQPGSRVMPKFSKFP